jgi:hypothetical protein
MVYGVYNKDISFNNVLQSLKYATIDDSLEHIYFETNRTMELFIPFRDIIYPLYLKEKRLMNY